MVFGTHATSLSIAIPAPGRERMYHRNEENSKQDVSGRDFHESGGGS